MNNKLSTISFKLILLFPLYLGFGNLIAQSPNWKWVRSTDGFYSDRAYAIVADSTSSTYAIGEFLDDSIHFGSTVLFNAHPGYSTMYLVKHDSSGNAVWAITSLGSGSISPKSITLDSEFNVYLAGSLGGTVIFNSDTISSIGVSDIFIAKFDSAGNYIWSKRFGGLNDESAISISYQKSNQINVTGYFRSDSLVFDSDTMFNSSTYNDVFVGKLDTSGLVLWAIGFGGITDDEGYAIASSQTGAVIVSGYFRSNTLFIDSIGLFNSSFASYDIFIAAFDSLGNTIWAKSPTGSGGGIWSTLTIDDQDRIYLAGEYSGTIVWNTISINSSGNFDGYLCKMDLSGNALWVRSFGGTNADSPHSISTDGIGGIYLAGQYRSPTLNFGSISLVNTDPTFTDGFLVKYDSFGNLKWAKDVRGNNYEYSTSISNDPMGNVYIAGFYASPFVAFDNDTIYNNDNSMVHFDSFIAKLDSNYIANIHEAEFYQLINVYPNPASDIIHLNSISKISSVEIIDIYGRVGLVYNSHKFYDRIDISPLKEGVWFVLVKFQDAIDTRKLIISR